MPKQLTPELQEEVLQFLASGAFYDEVSEALGLGKRTIPNWIAKGETIAQRAAAGEEPAADDIRYVAFAVECRKARGRSVIDDHTRIRQAIRGGDISSQGVRAAMWHLAVTNPGRYASWTRRLDQLPTQEQQEGVLEPEERSTEAADADRQQIVAMLRTMREERARSANGSG